MGQILTIDTGGTKTRIVQFSEIFNTESAFDAPVLHEIEFSTPYDGDEYVAQVADVIRSDFPDFDCDENGVVAIAIRGQIANDCVSDAAKFGWDKFPVVEKLTDLVKKPVLVANDAKVGALGAFSTDFRGRGLYLPIGTGVGISLIIDGELSHEMSGTEVGSMRVLRGDEYIRWETTVSGDMIYEKTGFHGDELPPDHPFWHEYAESLGAGILTILPIFYPDEVIIGGGVANQFPYYGEMLQKFVQENTSPRLKNTRISAAHDPRYTVNRGALIYALKNRNFDHEN
ncbi:ROK family protein [Candidatus Saccharibacteria bacterium]|nr:ROK family protein [Candidatus Saccharibacteria bacterium]MCL1963302.1 ROK family protein [Candidatus Saccharibacteria bacterium]